ncbi:esterase-like activity of phytase family protein [Massilia sp. SR12]
MKQRTRTIGALAALALALGVALAGCGTPPRAIAPLATSVAGLRFIGEQRVPHQAMYDGTMLGGFSGLDYDAAAGRWVIASDDRCTHNPARFYEAKLDFDAQAFHAIRFVGVRYFLGREGCNGMDVEAIRVDPRDGSIWYASEGDRRYGIDPFISHARREGAHLAALPLPEQFRVYKDAERGSRYNATFEGIAFAPGGDSLWASSEWPLYADGPLPTSQQGAPVRMTQFGRDGTVLRQFAYELDAIPAPSVPGKMSENGVSEILTTPDGELLVLERATVQGADGRHVNYIRLYATDTRDASEVQALPALAGAHYRPARKRLVLDFGTLGLPRIDNLEAMAWGPRLPNGHATLVLASDDNFGKSQVSQFLLFEVLP